MGICVWSEFSDLNIPTSETGKALKAIKELQQTSTDYLRADTRAILNADSLKHALNEWGFDVADKTTGLSEFEFVGDKGDFTPLMYALAPHVESGGKLEMGMENDGSDLIVEFSFKDGKVTSESFLQYDEFRIPTDDYTKRNSENLNWYSEQIHFRYEGKKYRIVSWKDIDGDLEVAKKQVAKGLKYGKGSADYLEWSYEYTRGILAEKIHEELIDDDKKLQAVVTENRYGSLCLNTPSVAFIDLDKPGSKVKIKLQSQEKQAPYKQWIENSVKEYFGKNTEQSGVLYETAEGMRLVFTHDLFTVSEAKQQGFFDIPYCDPLYVKMCEIQECFRARLTPKPWRIEKGEKAAVCRKVAVFNSGKEIDNTELDAVLALHENYCIDDNLELA
ncbi:MAG: Unknown protein [uncultured Thiotrichaceae bacterium]|uniref:Uncharacterized protein n=1 Tax=uncultured Thiotrichaceae bacterium TaxID=298394 RepID=A0A6S6S8A4_9GAMM|nr:MAG: Unknown protein [uncultured Thiotrichaceae bacterium]